MTIKFYKTNEPYGFLNNFKKARMFIYGRWTNNVETPYQAQKATCSEDYDLIWNAKTPREARDLGQKIKIINNWDQIKLGIMKECIMAKFLQNHDLRKQLMDTGDEWLVEDSPIDFFWGCGKDDSGKNMLGKILMQVRFELKGE